MSNKSNLSTANTLYPKDLTSGVVYEFECVFTIISIMEKYHTLEDNITHFSLLHLHTDFSKVSSEFSFPPENRKLKIWMEIKPKAALNTGSWGHYSNHSTIALFVTFLESNRYIKDLKAGWTRSHFVYFLQKWLISILVKKTVAPITPRNLKKSFLDKKD